MSIKKDAKQSNVDIAIGLIDHNFAFSVDQHKQSIATMAIAPARINVPVNSPEFKSHVRDAFFQFTGKSISVNNVKEVVEHFTTKAMFSGEKYFLNRRYSFETQKNELFIDKCDDACTVLHLKDGQITSMTQAEAPVEFSFDESMDPQPDYLPGQGNWELIKRYVHLANEHLYPLLMAHIGQMMVRMGPYAMACFVGQAGSGKSEAARFILSLIDPGNNPLLSFTGNEKDIAISVRRSVALAFDNVEPFSKVDANILCRLLTGAGIKTRQLFTDTGEITLEILSPIIVTSIDQPIRTDDLMDRSITYLLARIPANKRKTMKDLIVQAKVDRPLIFSAILDMVALGLKNIDSVAEDELPRMADFAKFACACAPYFGLTSKQMLELYASSQQEMVADVADDSPFIRALHRLISRKKDAWQGNATELLKELEFAPEVAQKGWPQSSIAAGKQLTRFSEVLNKLGIDVEKIESHRRQLRLSKLPHFQPTEDVEISEVNIRRITRAKAAA